MGTREHALNEAQQQRLVVTCQHIDRLLRELEQSFADAQSNSPFRRFVNDLAPAEQRLVNDYIARIRTQLVRALQAQGLSPEPHRVAVRHAALTRLGYVEIDIEELKPHYMRGYGPITPEAEASLNGIVEELNAVVRQLAARLMVDRRETEARLARVATGDFAVVGVLDDLIVKYGLVEFRSVLDAIVDSLERRGLELGVFGRVSTGKSSLLNRLLDRDVLPIGVNPITAVPTRIVFGAESRLRVWFADLPPRELDISHLTEYASERENPANVKRVLRLVVELPSALLASGVALVDTPGLGSLATSGSAETLAYLPHCDAAAVLVDASATIAEEDVATIRLLLDGGIRVFVLLSKADLLNDADREAALAYTRATLGREFDRAIDVAAVSIKPELAPLYEAWREQSLVPLIANQEQEHRRAAARKLEMARVQVEAALRRRIESAPVGRQPDDSRTADAVLRTAVGRIAGVEHDIERVTLMLRGRTSEVLRDAAGRICVGARPQLALEAAFQDVAGGVAHAIAASLHELASSLEAARPRVSSPTESIRAGTIEAAEPIRGAPVPELPHDITVPGQGAEWILGRGIARSVIANRLERRIGKVVQNTLESYAAVLRRWARGHLEDIRTDWNASTDAFRADLDHQLGYVPRTDIDPAEVRRDLERLGQPVLP